jgi:hypothetical protein
MSNFLIESSSAYHIFLMNNLYVSIESGYDKNYNDICKVKFLSYHNFLSKENFADGLVFFWDNMTHSCGIIPQHTIHMMGSQADFRLESNLKTTLNYLMDKTSAIPHILPHFLYNLYFINLGIKNCNAKCLSQEALKQMNLDNQAQTLLDKYPQWFVINEKEMGRQREIAISVTKEFYLTFMEDMARAYQYIEQNKGKL